MVGVKSYGVYIPKYRLKRESLNSAMGWFARSSTPGEKAVANFDEDSVTMAVAACIDCSSGVAGQDVQGIYFASTTAPFKERSNATVIASALDLCPQMRNVDISSSVTAGVAALLIGAETVLSGKLSNILVASADCRLGKPGSSQESLFGDGAAAFLIGGDGVVASLEDSFAVSYDFPDHWRTAEDRFDRTIEDRMIRDEAYTKFIPEAISGLMKRCQLQSRDIDKVIYPCLYAADHGQIGKKLGFQPEQIQDAMVNVIGDAGAAAPLIMFVAALENAKPGDNIIVAGYGSGSCAVLFKVTEEIEKARKGSLGKNIASKTPLTSYEKYLAFKRILPIEVGPRGEVGPTQIPMVWRERRSIFGLVGCKCRKCNSVQYPPQEVCVNPDCTAVNEMDAYRFADKTGTIFSYTEDRLAFTISPPHAYAMVDFDGGGRNVFDITDCEPGQLRVGMPVSMTFRRKYLDEARGIHGYFWKASPSRTSSEVTDGSRY